MLPRIAPATGAAHYAELAHLNPVPRPAPPVASPRPAPAPTGGDQAAGPKMAALRKVDLPSIERNVVAQVVAQDGGGPIVRFVDRHTGEVIAQMPPEAVLHIVEDLIEKVRAEGATHGQHER